MTNSEAIETLKTNYPDPCFGLLREAVDVAINALSAQPDPIRLNIDHALTEEEIKNLKQKIADSPIVLMPSAQPDLQQTCNKLATDCISRQDAIDALGDEPEVWTGKDEYAMGLNNQWHYDKNAILKCPSAQPERKMGKWIDKSGGIENAWNYCSVCGEQAIDLYDFCPNCGADMRGGEDESN